MKKAPASPPYPPLVLSSMSLPQLFSYYFHLRDMQDLLKRHRLWRTRLAIGLLLAITLLVYGLLSGNHWLTGSMLTGTIILPFMMLTMPPLLQERYQRDIAALLRDQPPARDSQPPSLSEISRLLQSPEAFEYTLSRWLRRELIRCLTHGAPI